MLTKIDWISFSFPCDFPEGLTVPEFQAKLGMYLDDLSLDIMPLLHIEQFRLEGQGRAPYNLSFKREDNHAIIFFSTTLKHALCEISGQGCERLAQEGQLEYFLSCVQDRLTRIDIASDFLCDTDPIDFASKRIPGHFRAHSEFVSESGSTAYIGSRTSDRYARVYRYNPPHERAHLLRVEYVFKSETARLTAKSVLQHGAANVSKAAGDAFGWLHQEYQPEASEDIELAVWRPERHQGKTLFWLNDTVAPLLIRLQREGVLDATAWLRDNVTNKLSNPDSQ